VKIIHPFHPLKNQEFEFINLKQTWGQDRVFFRDSKSKIVSIPTNWTDYYEEIPFIKQAKGRAILDFKNMKELSHMLADLKKSLQNSK
jgi:hypothetical protein